MIQTSFFNMISAFISAALSFLLLISTFMVIGMLPSIVILTAMNITNPDEWWWLIIWVPVALITIEWCGLAYARFFLRCWPIKADGTGRRAVKLFLIVVLAIMILLGIGFAFSPLKIVGNDNIDPRIPIFLGLTVSPIIFSIFVGCFITLCIHFRPRYYTKRPFALYLRRFSSFSDRTVMGEVLKASPAGIPLLFPASPGNRPANWDSYMWAFSGLRILHPLSSLAIQIKATDVNWQDFIEKMVKDAFVIIMDLSSFSKSLEWEVELLSRYSGNTKVIWLLNESDDLPEDLLSSKFNKNLEILRYKSSFLSAIPGLFWKFTISIGTSILFVSTFLGLDAESVNPTQFNEVKMEFGISFFLLFFLFILFYTRAGISKVSRWRIRLAILDSTNQKK